MSISKCIVRLKDCHDTEHGFEVYAESLYEAVLRGLNRLQDIGWESSTGETVSRAEVEIHQAPMSALDLTFQFSRTYSVSLTGGSSSTAKNAANSSSAK